VILGLRPQSGRRAAPPVNNEGVISTIYSGFDFSGAIQPLGMREREALDPGFAERARYMLFTYEELHTLTDQVLHRGEWCEVFGWADWQDAPVLAHNEYVLLRPEPAT